MSRDQTSEQIVSLGSLVNRTGSGTFHPVVKEQPLLSSRMAYRQSLILRNSRAGVKRIRALLSELRFAICSARSEEKSEKHNSRIEELGVGSRGERKGESAPGGKDEEEDE